MSTYELEKHPAIQLDRKQRFSSSSSINNNSLADTNQPNNIMSSSSSTTIDLERVAPHELTKTDKLNLRALFEDELNITLNSTTGEIEDAIDLVDYALDMVCRGKNVQSIIQELEFMQYEICNAATAQMIGNVLSQYLLDMKNGTTTTTTSTKKIIDKTPNLTPLEKMLSPKDTASISSLSSLERKLKTKKEKLLRKSTGGSSDDDISLCSSASHSRRRTYDMNGNLIKQWESAHGKLSQSARDVSYDDKMHEYFQQLEDDKLRVELNARQSEARKEIALKKKKRLTPPDSKQNGSAEIEALQKVAPTGVKKKIYDEDGNLLSWGGGKDDVDTEDSSSEDDDDDEDGGDDDAAADPSKDGADPVEKDDGDKVEDKEKTDDTEKEDSATTSTWAPVIPGAPSLTKKKKSREGRTPRSPRNRNGKNSSSFTNGIKGKTESELEALKATVQDRGVKSKVYDEHGNLIPTGAWDKFKRGNSRGSGMDDSSEPSLKTKLYDENGNLIPTGQWDKFRRGHSRGSGPDGEDGTLMLMMEMAAVKKESELEALKATVQDRSVKSKVYDEHGNLIPTGQWDKFKRAHSRGSGPGEDGGADKPKAGIKTKLYDENGNLIPTGQWDKFKRGGDDAEDDEAIEQARMEKYQAIMRDHSLTREERSKRIEDIKIKYGGVSTPKPSGPGGATTGTSSRNKKKYADLEALKAHKTGQGIKQKLYDADGNIIVQWKDNQNDGDGGYDWICETSAEGMRMKKAREVEALGLSMSERSGSMFNEDGNIISPGNNAGERDNQYPDMDTSAEGMKLKLQKEMEYIRASSEDFKKKMFDDDGNIVTCTNEEGEHDLRGSDMDTSSGGVIRKKHKEVEELRLLGAAKSKSQMYDADGNIKCAWKSLDSEERQFAKSTPIGSSAEGTKMKQIEEIAALRNSTCSQNLKTQMFDANGNIVNSTNNVGERDNQYPDMDTSAEGMRRKLQREMDAIRRSGTVDYKSTTPPRKLKKDEITNLRRLLKSTLRVPNPSYNEEAEDLLDYGMDLIEEGKNVGYVMDELLYMGMSVFTTQEADSFGQYLSSYLVDLEGGSTLAQRSKASMFDVDGNIVNTVNNAGERDNQNPDIDTSAEGMKLKLQKEINAIRRSGTVDYKRTTRPRALTEQEVSTLQELLKSTLKIPNPSYDQEAEDMLEYAMELIEEGKAVGYVLDELLYMEMSVFTAEVAESFGQYLSSYLSDLDGGTTLAQRTKASMFDDNGNIVGCANHAGEQNSQYPDMNTSADGMKKKLSREMDEVRAAAKTKALMDVTSGGMILKNHQEVESLRAQADTTKPKQKMYDADGKLIAWASLKSDERQCSKSSQGANETKLLSKNSSGSRVKKEIYDENGILIKQWAKTKEEEDGMDLSAMGNIRNKQSELESLKATVKNSDVKKKVYDENGNLISWEKVKSFNDEKAKEDEKNDPSPDAFDSMKKKRAQELEVVMRTKGLSRQERSKRIEEVKRKYDSSAACDATGEDTPVAATAAARPNSELGFLRSRMHEVTQGNKEQAFDEWSGKMKNQWSKVDKTEIVDIDDHIDKQRREYFAQLDNEAKLRERIAARDKLRREEEEAKNHDVPDTKQAATGADDLKLLKKTSSGADRKKNIYDENGVLVKQWASKYEEVDDEGDNTEQSLEARKKEELLSVMHNRSLGRDERTKRIEEVKRKYSTGAPHVPTEEKHPPDVGKVEAPLVPVTTSANSAQRQQEFEAIMRDRSLGKEERKERLEELKRKYTQGSGGEQGVSNAGDEKKKKEELVAPSPPAGAGNVVPQSPFKTFMSKSVDEQRRTELQAIMKDHTLSKDERSRRMEEVKARYEAAEAANPGAAPSQVDDLKKKPSGTADKTLDEQRRAELRCIMKNRNISQDVKNRLLEEVKVKYDALIETEASQAPSKPLSSVKVKASPPKPKSSPRATEKVQEAKPPPSKPKPIQTQPKRTTPMTKAEFTKDVLKSNSSKGQSVKDRMAKFNNGSAINFDPVAFAVGINKNQQSFKAREAAKRDATQSAMKYNYNYGDGGVVEQTVAEVKAHDDNIKAAKMESVESAKQYDYKYTG